jgi:diguanylate cyclase (GGDEF)-like protein
VVEDNAADARLLREMFSNERQGSFEMTHLSRMSEAVTHLANNEVDIVLLDLGSPDAHGLESVRRAHTAAPNVPLIVLTGMDDEALATEAMKEGAQDYLIKGQVENRALPRALRHAIERHRIQIETKYIAQHDAVTNLPNRLLLRAVIFLDLDRFKYINDSLGHLVGDQLLQSVSLRLLAAVRDSDTVSRQGGDEFIILLSEITHPQHAAVSAKKILHALGAPHSIGGHELHIDGSIGISVFPGDGEDAETLIKNADTAMYDAKEKGRNNFQFFTAEMNLKMVERQTLEASLRRALERSEFLLHYQPKVNLSTGEITSVEALIRWQHPERVSYRPANSCRSPKIAATFSRSAAGCFAKPAARRAPDNSMDFRPCPFPSMFRRRSSAARILSKVSVPHFWSLVWNHDISNWSLPKGFLWMMLNLRPRCLRTSKRWAFTSRWMISAPGIPASATFGSFRLMY